jgi:hypothetical protein
MFLHMQFMWLGLNVAHLIGAAIGKRLLAALSGTDHDYS